MSRYRLSCLFSLSTTALLTMSGLALAATAVHAQPATGIISPTDASALKGRMAVPTDLPLPASLPVVKTAPYKPKGKVAVAPITSVTPKAIKTAKAPAEPTAGRGDEDSYQERGILKSQYSGTNRFGGSTFSVLHSILTIDFDDALAGFMSFDKLGTLRERMVYRANGTSVSTVYDARTGDVINTKTDTPNPDAAITAGSVVVMPGTTYGALLKRGVPAVAKAPAAEASDGVKAGITGLIPADAP